MLQTKLEITDVNCKIDRTDAKIDVKKHCVI